VWVIYAGLIKEKVLIEELKDGGLRFQAEISHLDGKSHLDRTMLTPLPGSRVHQVIEAGDDSQMSRPRTCARGPFIDLTPGEHLASIACRGKDRF
jgi:hypothetical protein